MTASGPLSTLERRAYDSNMVARKGIEVLRRIYGDEPGRRIDPDSIDQADPLHCMLAQWSGKTFDEACKDLRLEHGIAMSPAMFGFEVYGTRGAPNYFDLTAAFQKQLKLYRANVLSPVAA